MKRLFFSIILCAVLILQPGVLLADEAEAVFAGGCFWCLEHDLESLPGVITAISGYAGGTLQNPTYRNHAGHQESVKVRFDDQVISYKTLLENYWVNIDPFDGEGQFCDRGDSYRPVIFIIDNNQQTIAQESADIVAKRLNTYADKIAVEIKPLNNFWEAEDYHQNYAEANTLKYNFYRYSCGRDDRLNAVWKERS